MIYENILEAIGNTPLVRLGRIVPEDSAEILVKYEGYIKRQLADIHEQQRMEDRTLPQDIDYMNISTIRTEARQKLTLVRPETLGQAMRISGVSPADIGALMVYLSHREV